MQARRDGPQTPACLPTFLGICPVVSLLSIHTTLASSKNADEFSFFSGLFYLFEGLGKSSNILAYKISQQLSVTGTRKAKACAE